MSLDSENSCVFLSSRDSRTSCIFQTADEKDDIPGVGEESVLEMLSYSKFSDLETWLCMPSSLLLPRLLDSAHTSSSSSSSSSICNTSATSSLASNFRLSTYSDPGETVRSSDTDAFLSPTLAKEMPFLVAPSLPVLSSTPATSTVLISGDSTPQGSVGVRKRRRLAACPGGLHWNSSGSVQRDFWSPDLSPISRGVVTAAGGRNGVKSLPLAEGSGASVLWTGDRAALSKTVSVDEQLLRPAGGEQRQLRVLSRLERGRKKLRSIHVSLVLFHSYCNPANKQCVI